MSAQAAAALAKKAAADKQAAEAASQAAAQAAADAAAAAPEPEAKKTGTQAAVTLWGPPVTETEPEPETPES